MDATGGNEKWNEEREKAEEEKYTMTKSDIK